MTRLLRSKRLACGVAAAGLLTASVAWAAEPESGTIGSSAPKVEWGGTLASSGIFHIAWADDPTIECSPPTCDPFALTIADGPHPVTIKLSILSTNADGSDPGAGVRIRFPDGSYQYTEGTSSEKTPMQVKLKSAAKGDYEITSVSSHVCCGTEDYVASAEITGAGGSPTTPGGPTPTPTPPPSGGDQPAPQLTVKPSKASARKLKKTRKYKVQASTTAPLTKVVARLLKGKKVLARAKLARLEGTANLVLKVAKKAKLKKGTHTVTVSGVDSQNRTVTTGVKVKVRK